MGVCGWGWWEGGREREGGGGGKGEKVVDEKAMEQLRGVPEQESCVLTDVVCA